MSLQRSACSSLHSNLSSLTTHDILGYAFCAFERSDDTTLSENRRKIVIRIKKLISFEETGKNIFSHCPKPRDGDLIMQPVVGGRWDPGSRPCKPWSIDVDSIEVDSCFRGLRLLL